jgi:tetratricopeptide (TPR) repeat protein
VILDFGIAGEIATAGTEQTIDDTISGTVEYMAPEQCAGEPCGPASDWYAVGVLLYEALTGTVPFKGSVLEILRRKLVEDPPPPSEIVSGLPADLVDSCVALMARDPAERPSDPALLGRLRVSEPAVAIDHHAVTTESVDPVGRASELAALEDAFETAAGGQSVSLCVYGRSGIGKTMLVRHFNAGLRSAERAVVLSGRCYVRESVPYKALDGVIDKMSRLLKSLPAEQVEERLPKDTGALAWVFPVLRRVQAIDRRAELSLGITDRRELRRRAFAALREAFETISLERPVVIHIDDLQWADQDSIDVLHGLLESFERARLLFILSFRSEEISNLPFLEQLLARAGTPAARAIELGPLSTADAASYVETMLGPKWPAAHSYAQTLARDSDGNPFLLDQMARVALAVGGERDTRSLRVGEMLNTRVSQMPEGARELVEVLAIAGQPIDAEVAYQSAGLLGDERPLVTSLRIAHLLRTSASGQRVDLYHDRIREHFAQDLSTAEVRSIHRRLANGIGAKGIDDPESLYEHYLGARELNRAAVFAGKAAEVAQKALAFERAASFYRRALELSAGSGPQVKIWYVGLGDALANAGRGGEAARAYLQAATLADANTALELQRRAGQQLMISGRIAEGLEVISRVLAKVGLKLAPTPKRALLSLVARRARLKLRGLEYEERCADELSADEVTRIDTCWAVAEGMALVDNIQGAAFQTLHLILALNAGEPTRIARALAMEAGFAASTGASAESARLLEQAEQLARRLDSQAAIGLCRMIGTVAALHGGKWDEGAELAKQAEEILVRQQAYASWPLNIARVYYMSCLVESGRISELCRLSVRFLQDALDRGNLFAATMFRTGWSTLVWLGADDLDGARAALADALEHCPEDAFYIPHYNCLLAQGMVDLYAGEGEHAYRHITEVWSLLESSLLLRIRSVRVRCLQFRASCALAAAATSPDRDKLLRVAEHDAERMEQEKHFSVESNRAKATLLRAGIEATRGNATAALDYVVTATKGFEACKSALWHAVSARKQGELLGGDEGRELIAEADAWFASENIVNSERIVAMLVPGVGR